MYRGPRFDGRPEAERRKRAKRDGELELEGGRTKEKRTN